MISKWQRSRDSHASHLLNGMVSDIGQYQSISAQYRMCIEIVEDLKRIAGGVEDDDEDDQLTNSQ